MIITSDTTWTKANNPYTVTGPVAVATGTTLTIEAGVTVNLNNRIEVNGTLEARGSDNDQIYFNNINGNIAFSLSSTKWDKQTGSGCAIEKAILESAIYVEGGSPLIRNNTLRTIEVQGGSPTISKNVIGGFPMEGAGISLESGNAIVSDNTIYGCGDVGIGISDDNHDVPTIEGNFIFNNTCGINVWSGATIRSNTIAKNINGIIVNSPLATITNNNIQNNKHNLYSITASNVDVTNNYWGTPDTSAINKTIYDKKNDYNLGTVNFVPFLTAPNLDAPAITSTPNSPPTPTDNSTATKPTDQTDNEPLSELQIQEIAIVALIALIIALLTIIVRMHQKPKHQDKTQPNNPTTQSNQHSQTQQHL